VVTQDLTAICESLGRKRRPWLDEYSKAGLNGWKDGYRHEVPDGSCSMGVV
jgi:hypothetical protein